MLHALTRFDQYLFHFINHDLGNQFFDWLMPWLRNAKFWIPLYAFILVFTIWKYKRRGVIIIALLILTVGTADFTSATLIKKTVKRLRPCNEPSFKETVISRVDCGTGYSFPSTHATDHFSMALFLAMVFYKRWRWIWFWAILWAAVISFAQVYVGVHYPIDVMFGALYGSAIGALFAMLDKRLQPAFYKA